MNEYMNTRQKAKLPGLPVANINGDYYPWEWLSVYPRYSKNFKMAKLLILHDETKAEVSRNMYQVARFCSDKYNEINEINKIAFIKINKC